ncbi:MAG: DUF4340 domain-containing protein [Acidobacteriota bacterium]
MKPRTVLILALLVGLLGALIWFVERDLPSSEERSELAKKLFRLETGEVTALSVEWNGRTVRFARDSEGDARGWRIVEPLDARADAAEVDRLLAALTGLETKRTIEDAEPAAVGLDAPRGVVTLRTEADGWILRVGASVPTSEDVLVSLASLAPASPDAEDRGEGRTVEAHVTSGSFVERLDRDPGAWRDRNVFPGVRSAVERLTLRGSAPEGPVVLAARDGDRFRIEEPISDLADADRVDALLSELTGLRVERFVDDPSSEVGGAADPGQGPTSDPTSSLGLEPPRAVVEAGLSGGGSFRLELGAAVASDGAPTEDGPELGSRPVYARADGQIFTVSTDLPSMAARPAAEWRSPAWTALRGFQVESMEVTEAAAGGGFTLERDGSLWRRDGEEIPYAAVSDLLAAVTGAEGEVAADEPPGAAGESLLTLRLTPREGEPVTLELFPGTGDGGGSLARSSERSTVIRLSAESGAEVLDAAAAVRAAEPEAAEEIGAAPSEQNPE